jgi:ubiquinone/menaquinone biosynthesis C-methylase UbiE
MTELYIDHRGLYSDIVDWYVQAFYRDFSDSQWLLRLVDYVTSGGLVLDVGCGPGQFARFLRKKNLSVISIDLSEAMLNRGLSMDPCLHPLVGDIHCMPISRASADGLLAAYTFEHVLRSRGQQVFHEMSRVVKPGAPVALMTKCGRGTYEFGSPRAPGKRGILQLWSIEELVTLAANAGFEVLGTDTKPPSSPHEFMGDRGFLLLRRGGPVL